MCGGQKTDLTITQTFTMETTINGLVSVLGCMQRGALGTWSMLAYNGLRLCEEADFGAQNCQYSTKVDAR